jgi:5-methylcytosine-specific restriction enzyme subunit McrC
MFPTLELTERVTTRCRLRPAVVAHLLERHAAQFDVLPEGRRHLYRLTPRGIVGSLDAPGLRIVIRPKIPLCNVFDLLDPCGPLPEPTGTEPEPGDVLGFLAMRLMVQMNERSRAGLQRGYTERELQGTFLRGQLDVPAQLRGQRREQLHCRLDEFDTNVPCNQAAVSAVSALLECPLLGEELRPALWQTLHGYPGVTAPPLDVNLIERALASRPPEAYLALLGTCRLLAESLSAGAAPAFLLDLGKVFESYVTAGVCRAFAGSSTTLALPQEGLTLAIPTDERPGLAMRPDVTVMRDGRAVAVLDVKWKRLLKTALDTEDVYQVIAYCAALGVVRGVLVYPGARERSWDYAIGNIRLTIRSLRLVGEAERCRRGLRRLGRWLRQG